MKLTKSDREAFVKACLDDVPSVDYHEVARTKAMAWAKARMPDCVAKTYELDTNWINTVWVPMPGSICDVYLPVIGEHDCIEKLDPDFWKELNELNVKNREQSKTQQKLREELTGAIAQCSTLKQAQERLPEFVKYLPADRSGERMVNLPVANLISHLTAAGWPKDQPLAQGAQA